METNNSNDEMIDIQKTMFVVIDALLGKGYTPLSVAAALATTAFMLYKTVLTESDYEKVTDYIHGSRGNIQKITASQGSVH